MAPFTRLVSSFRFGVFEEVAASDLPGLIHTWVWAFDRPGDLELVSRLRTLFGDHGGRVVFVELYADLDTRPRRNETEERLSAKPSKRDVATSRIVERFGLPGGE